MFALGASIHLKPNGVCKHRERIASFARGKKLGLVIVLIPTLIMAGQKHKKEREKFEKLPEFKISGVVRNVFVGAPLRVGDGPYTHYDVVRTGDYTSVYESTTYIGPKGDYLTYDFVLDDGRIIWTEPMEIKKGNPLSMLDEKERFTGVIKGLTLILKIQGKTLRFQVSHVFGK